MSKKIFLRYSPAVVLLTKSSRALPSSDNHTRIKLWKKETVRSEVRWTTNCETAFMTSYFSKTEFSLLRTKAINDTGSRDSEAMIQPRSFPQRSHPTLSNTRWKFFKKNSLISAGKSFSRFNWVTSPQCAESFSSSTTRKAYKNSPPHFFVTSTEKGRKEKSISFSKNRWMSFSYLLLIEATPISNSCAHLNAWFVPAQSAPYLVFRATGAACIQEQSYNTGNFASTCGV